MSGSCATTGLDADVCFGTCCVPPSPGEALRQNIIKALRDAGAWCGVCDYEDGPCTDCLATLGDYADDLLPVVRAYAAEELRAAARPGSVACDRDRLLLLDRAAALTVAEVRP